MGPVTRSVDGYLHTDWTEISRGASQGAHPELGDMVYNAGGTALGRVKFFYSQPSPISWLVAVEGLDEDPIKVIAKLEPHEANNSVQAWWLCAIPGEAAVYLEKEAAQSKVHVGIQNFIATQPREAAPESGFFGRLLRKIRRD